MYIYVSKQYFFPSRILSFSSYLFTLPIQAAPRLNKQVECVLLLYHRGFTCFLQQCFLLNAIAQQRHGLIVYTRGQLHTLKLAGCHGNDNNDHPRKKYVDETRMQSRNNAVRKESWVHTTETAELEEI